MTNQLFYVTVSYGRNGTPTDKGGYLMAASYSRAMQIASDKVREYPTTNKVWGSEASLTDTNGYDSYTFDQPADFWDNEYDTDYEEDEEE